MEFLDKLHGVDEKSVSPTSPQRTEEEISPSISSETLSQVLWKDHPTYFQFFRQVRMGVPIDAVKSKMRMNGYDPSILEYSFFILIN